MATVDGIDRANLNKKEATAVALCVGASNLASNFSTVCRDLKILLSCSADTADSGQRTTDSAERTRLNHANRAKIDCFKVKNGNNARCEIKRNSKLTGIGTKREREREKE